MSSGAVQLVPRQCKEDGCCLPVRARNMCSKHYQRWAAANPQLRTQVMMRKAILAALPAWPHQICEESGLDIQTVKRHLKAMQASGDVHIWRYDPPDVTGYKWVPVWQAGPGANARVTEKMRTEYRCKRQRRAYKRRAVTKLGWLGALGVPIKSPFNEVRE